MSPTKRFCLLTGLEYSFAWEALGGVLGQDFQRGETIKQYDYCLFKTIGWEGRRHRLQRSCVVSTHHE